MPDVKLFSPEWTARFVAAWNRDATAEGAAIRNSRPTGFRALEAGAASLECSLAWDERGQVSASQAPPVRWFEAGLGPWEDLMRQRVKAVPSVMSGRIRYHGDLAFLMRSALAFDRVAVVAASVHFVDDTAPVSRRAFR